MCDKRLVIFTTLKRLHVHNESLLTALIELGFGPTYHMKEALFEEQGVSTDGHLAMWKDAAEGKLIDWDVLFENYNSAVDHPVAGFPVELYNQYPNAKYILTIRDAEKWYDSIQDSICWFHSPDNNSFKILPHLPFFPFTRIKQQKYMLDSYVKHKIGHHDATLNTWADFCNEANKGKAINSFEQHNEDVKDLIPTEQLLIFETGKTSYKELANFLGVDTPPSSPYPYVNSKEQFRKIRLNLQIAAVVVVIIGLLAAGFLVRTVKNMFVTKQEGGVKTD